MLGQLSLDIPTIFIFALFFALAMINRRKSDVHMRYMVGTSLLMIGPGLGRSMIIFGGVPFPVAVTIAYYVSEIIALIFLLNDVRKGANIKPFLTILTVLVINHFIWAFQDALWWQKIAKGFVTLTF